MRPENGESAHADCRARQIIESVPTFFFLEDEKKAIQDILSGAAPSLTPDEMRILVSVQGQDNLAKKLAISAILRGRGVVSNIDVQEKSAPPKQLSTEAEDKVEAEVIQARRLFSGDKEKFATVVIDACLTFVDDPDEAENRISFYLKREKLDDPRILVLRGRAGKEGRGRKERVTKARKSSSIAKVYMPAILVNGILPQQDPGDESFWSRQDANRCITISSGLWRNPETGNKEYTGLPFGKIARLILLDIVTQAKVKKTRTIFAADTVHGMIKSLGMAWGGTTAARVRAQVTRLFASRITIEDITSSEHDLSTELRVCERRHLLWEPNPQDEGIVEEKSFIRLSPEFYEEIIARSVPLGEKASQVLLSKNKTSGFDFDLYTILSKRCFRPAGASGPPTILLKWSDLAEQTGVRFSRPRDFRRRVGKALERIWQDGCWPESKKFLSIETGGIMVSWAKGASPHVATLSR